MKPGYFDHLVHLPSSFDLYDLHLLLRRFALHVVGEKVSEWTRLGGLCAAEVVKGWLEDGRRAGRGWISLLVAGRDR